MMKDVSLVASLSRLVVVALLMAGVLLLLRKTTTRGRSAPKRGPQRAIELVDRQSLGKAQSIAVLRVHGSTIVVGVTEQRVELLSLLDEPDRDDALDDDDDLIDPAEVELAQASLRSRAHTARRSTARTSARRAAHLADDGDDQFFERLRRRSAR